MNCYDCEKCVVDIDTGSFVCTEKGEFINDKTECKHDEEE